MLFLLLPALVSAGFPKIVFFVLGDDIGHNMLGFTAGSAVARGGPGNGSFTPRLDALAAEGLILDNAVAAFWCTPSRSSFLTGRLPVHVQSGQDFPETPHAGVPRYMGSIAAKLAAAGVQPHVVGKWDMVRPAPRRTERPINPPPFLFL